MKKLVMAAVVAACAAETFAMPTKQEMAKAQPLVVELMAPAMAKYKSAGYKEKAAAAAKVGDASSEFAKAAETEAAKFLLLKGAVNFYTRGEQYDKAADTVAELQRAVKDVPPAVIAEITGKATSRISEAKAPRLYAVYRTAKLQVRASDEAKALKAKLKKAKSDALQRKYAEALAVSGDWKAAYAEFAKVSDAKLKEIVKAESEGNAKSAESGEFWWAYESAFEEADDFFKSHAAAYYRKALDAGEITGLKKNLVEQRIKGVAAEVMLGAKKVILQDKRIVLHLPNASDIVLIRCPAGKFTMGYDTKPTAFVKHEVTITRPFWMSEGQITVGQYCALMGSFNERFEPRGGVNPPDGLRKLEEVMGGSETIVGGTLIGESDSFCDKATKAFKNLLPPGYVVRLPTDAEREYGFSCGCTTKDRVYKELVEGKRNVKDLESVCGNEIEFAKQCMARAGVTFPESRNSVLLYEMPPRWKSKQFRPNDWGFFDMAGQNWERVLDRFPPIPDGNYSWERSISYLNGLYTKCVCQNKPDPLMYYTGSDASPLVVTRQGWHAKLAGIPSLRSWHQVFRIVVGPDLVSEWKAKHGKK